MFSFLPVIVILLSVVNETDMMAVLCLVNLCTTAPGKTKDN